MPLHRTSCLGRSKKDVALLVLSELVRVIPLMRDVTDRDGDNCHLDSAPLRPPTHSTQSPHPATYDPQNPLHDDGIQSCQQESVYLLILRLPAARPDHHPSAHEGIRCYAKRTTPLHLGRARREEHSDMYVITFPFVFVD